MSVLRFQLTIFVTVCITLLPGEALAYAGPGAGISAVGTLFSIIAAFFLAIVGFIWYPIKRLLRRFRAPSIEAPSLEPSKE